MLRFASNFQDEFTAKGSKAFWKISGPGETFKQLFSFRLKDDTHMYHEMTIASVDHNKIAAVTETLHIKGQSDKKKRKRDE